MGNRLRCGFAFGSRTLDAAATLAKLAARHSHSDRMSPYEHARKLIDEAHAADPERTADGLPAELVYADRVERWVARLDPAAPEILRLAARCQHLERWRIPRGSFPLDRAGYLEWRRSLYQAQAGRARELLSQAGVSAAEAEDAHRWVSKTGLKTDAGTQLLEDAAVLVFLEHEIADFAASHADYTRDKFLDILRKTWRKIGPDARAAASRLELPPAIADLIREVAAE